MGQLVFQATAGGQVALVGPNPSASFSLNVPAVSGTLVTTGDTGTVTNTMLASNAYTAPGTIGSGTANSGAFTSLSATSFTNTGTDTATKFIPTGSSVTGNGLYLPATNSLGLSTNGTNALYIDASQNVGIGTSSPATKLDVVGTIRASQSLAFGTNGTSGVGTIYSDSNWGCLITAKQASPALADFMWQNGSSVERMRIDSSGNLLVGTTTAIGKLTVAGLASAQTLQVKGSSSGSFSADAMFLQNEGPSLFRSYACGTNGSTYGQWVHYAVTSTGSPVSVFTASNGSFAVPGALSKGSGSFRIDHPLPELEETHQLVHSFIEGPQADLIYRGRVSLVNGKATVNIDEAATMTEGTFVVLCRDVQCFTTNESDWTPVRGSVSGNIITIESQDDKATSNISWMVIGERQDKHMMETNWTDESGKVIVEPLKVAPPLIMAGVNTETEGAK